MYYSVKYQASRIPVKAANYCHYHTGVYDSGMLCGRLKDKPH